MLYFRLIYQQEIAYFRSARDNVDVVRGEILPAYVQKVRDDGKLDIGLRAFGGKQKSMEASDQILEMLRDNPDGTLEVGDKSAPEDINRLFPGVSKTVSAINQSGARLLVKDSFRRIVITYFHILVLYRLDNSQCSIVWSFPIGIQKGSWRTL